MTDSKKPKKGLEVDASAGGAHAGVDLSGASSSTSLDASATVREVPRAGAVGEAAHRDVAEARDTTGRLQGNVADYMLGTREGWGAFRVVRWHALEELSQLFRFTVDLARDVGLGPVDLDALVDTEATFTIASARHPRVVHGVIASIEELEHTRAVFLYRVEIEPHLSRARYRSRCRYYQRQSLKEIVAMVLENRAPGRPGGVDVLSPFQTAAPTAPELPGMHGAFVPAVASYRFVITGAEGGRLDDPEYLPSVVQYNESDFALVSRLLETEGLSYYFEHTTTEVVMTITDDPGRVGLFATRQIAELRHALGFEVDASEFVRSYRPKRAARSRAVRIRDYWQDYPFSQPQGLAVAAPDAEARSEHVEFPSPGGSLADGASAPFFASLTLERFEAERAMASGSGNVRGFAPGATVLLRDPVGAREDVEVLVVAVETYAAELDVPDTELEHEPFGFVGEARMRAPRLENRFRAVPIAKVFRPARRTPKPSISGIHRAIVTAEEFAPGDKEINSDSDGDVRVRLVWDERPPEPFVPSSPWVPVANPWAGTGYGAVNVPRVGQSVFVAFDHGDPDWPIVLGGYYSEQTPAPYDPSKQPTVFGFKSSSSPGGGGFNEIRFDDAAGSEALSVNAQTDHTTNVGRNASRSVGADDASDVQGDQSTSVTGDRDDEVGGISSGGVGADKKVTVKGDYDIDVTGAMNITAQNVDITARGMVSISAPFIMITASAAGGSGSSYIVIKPGEMEHVSKFIMLDAGESSKILMDPGEIKQTSPMINLNPD